MSERNDLKQKTISGLFWRFAERCGAQGVSFIVSIVLARLLAPNDYGLIAMVTVFITISQVFVDSGMGNALIQKKDADNLDFSSVFYFNIVLCLIIYAILFFISPYIAKFYNSPELVPVLRVLSLTVVISAIKNVQQAYVSKHMLFKRFFYSTLGGTLIAAIVGIVIAYLGYGVWALVAQQLVNTIIDTTILWVTVKWRPTKEFSFERLKRLFSFGWKLLVSALIDTVYNNVRQLIIGKLYSSADLGYYNRGKTIPNLVVTNINSSIDSVLLPALSVEQSHVEKVKAMTRRAIKISSYIMWPMMIGIVVVAEPLVRILLTEKWIDSVPYLRIFCIMFAFQPIQTANLNAIKAMGRADLFLKLEIVKKGLGLLILLGVVKYGVLAIAGSLLIYTFVAQVLNSLPNKKLLNYSYFEQLKDIVPYIGLASLMAIIIYPISMLNWSDFVIIAIQVALGVTIYVIGSIIFRFDSFRYIYNILMNLLKR